ncbi:serine/threonine-protein kinase Nek2 [Leptosomus discolor]
MPGRPADYEVLLTIGSGSYGKCRKVRRKADGKVLVWKEIDYGSMTKAEKLMLVSEVNLLRELRHPNIVRYYDRIIDRSNTTLYIVMEYCEGGDLASLIARCMEERCYLEESFVLRALTQLALALKECHRRSDGGVTVHRDLKPANVFLDGKRNVKLGDFGLARILHHDTSFARTFVGTPYYMSPEQMNHMSYNEKSDIWSLGCLLYELCALLPPFRAYNQKELAEKKWEGKFRRIPYRYSEQLNELIKEMLNVKDYCRPSVEDILQHPLIADLVTEEQRQNFDKRVWRLWEPERLQHSDAAENELKRKEQVQEREQQVQEREQQVQEREQQVQEREQQRERELCVREKLAEDKLARAENLMRIYNLYKQQKTLTYADGPDNELPLPFFTTNKKVHSDGNEENAVPSVNLENCPVSKGKWSSLKKRLYAANLQLKHCLNWKNTIIERADKSWACAETVT